LPRRGARHVSSACEWWRRRDEHDVDAVVVSTVSAPVSAVANPKRRCAFTADSERARRNPRQLDPRIVLRWGNNIDVA